MSTISVTVNQPNHAAMLAEWLRNIRFVEKVDVKIDEPAKRGNAGEIMKMIDSIKSKNMLSNIADPVAYQKQLRDEWERN
jgi:hypothetical protein